MAGVRGWALRWKEILLGSEALPGPLDQGREMNGDGEGPHIRPFLAEIFFPLRWPVTWQCGAGRWIS